MSHINEFVRSLELSEGDHSLNFKPVIDEGYDDLEMFEGDSAIINFKSLNSFVAGVSKQRQEDVLNSLLLAQRVATKAFPEDEQIKDWYKRYFEVLDKIGWVFENREFAAFNAKSNLFEIENAILEILGSAISGNQLAVLKATMNALKSLGKEDKRFLAFEKNSHSLQKGSFQIGVATEENNTLSISASAFILNTKENITKILFFNSNSDSTAFWFCHSKATLNDSVFSDAREVIKQRLGDTGSFVAALEL